MKDIDDGRRSPNPVKNMVDIDDEDANVIENPLAAVPFPIAGTMTLQTINPLLDGIYSVRL